MGPRLREDDVVLGRLKLHELPKLRWFF